jgi:hypothetical protein
VNHILFRSGFSASAAPQPSGAKALLFPRVERRG